MSTPDLGYRVAIISNADCSDGPNPGWRIQDQMLAWALGLESNHDALERVRGAMVTHAGISPECVRRVELDSEISTFYAYAEDRADLETLADVIARLVAAGPHPNMRPRNGAGGPGFYTPGTMTTRALDTGKD